MENPKLTEKDLHCIARLIQNLFQSPEQKTIQTSREFYGCMYCKFALECQTPKTANFSKVLKKLRELTGVMVSTYQCEPERLGYTFLPASYYLEHPEYLHYLKSIHTDEMVKKIKVCLDDLINRAKETSGHKQDKLQEIHCHIQNDTRTDL